MVEMHVVKYKKTYSNVTKNSFFAKLIINENIIF